MELRCVFRRFLKMAKDSTARIELGRSFHQEETFNLNLHKCIINVHKLRCPLQNMQNVNHFNKISGIMKIACYCLFNTVLN